MLLSTRGIVLRALKYAESSMIVDIYTEHKGLQSFIISGVRKGKSKVGPALLQVTGLVDIVTYYNESRDLHRIKEIKSAYPYSNLLFDIRKSSVGLFVAEVCRRSLQKGEENTAMFNFIFGAFQQLDRTERPIANFHLCFMVGLSSYLGFSPYGSFSTLTPYFDLREGSFMPEMPLHADYLSKEESHILAEILGIDLENFWEVQLPRNQRNRLVENLITFFKVHLDHFKEIHSHKILEEVLGNP